MHQPSTQQRLFAFKRACLAAHVDIVAIRRGDRNGTCGIGGDLLVQPGWCVRFGFCFFRFGGCNEMRFRFAIAPDNAVAIFGGNLNRFDVPALHERVFDQAIPAVLRNGMRAVLLQRTGDTANHQPLFRARHRHI